MRFPDRARKAVAFLFRSYNDIDVYVEDGASRNMYEVLLSRMLQGNARVTRVIQLGGRDRVLAECAADQLPSERRRLYIIDGDLDLLTQTPPVNLKYLYRLGVYTSENLVVSAGAVVEIGYECLSNSPRAEVEQTLELDRLFADLARLLVPLFATYAVARQIRPQLETVGRNVMTLCTQRGLCPVLDEQKISARIESLCRECESIVARQEIDARIAEMQTSFGDPAIALIRFVSGKTYLLPLLYHHLRTKAAYAGTIEQLKVRLARYTELDLDPGLLDSVVQCARS
ncbi:DUF4435 domain-containing protein [Longimicrobium sp.]|uniref:DUF4435 domain-containing protein n=1 Tax=Longimicrobium sp. TaxID=2029185 RepID=UPI002E33BAD1|nr:DUF4435 domain-containing protein [Longimicrobium sp.]HEX6037917.1 DUF4435 domain-containing protein [Longimicrobium sp.]